MCGNPAMRSSFHYEPVEGLAPSHTISWITFGNEDKRQHEKKLAELVRYYSFSTSNCFISAIDPSDA